MKAMRELRAGDVVPMIRNPNLFCDTPEGPDRPKRARSAVRLRASCQMDEVGPKLTLSEGHRSGPAEPEFLIDNQK